MHPSVTLTLAAASGEHQLIDLDGTFFIQLVLFLLTYLVARRFLFTPYLKMRAARAAGTEGARAAAANAVAEANAVMADYDAKLEAARARANQERRTLRAEAATHLREVTEAARDEAGKAFTEARDTINREVSAARDDLLPRSTELARDIFKKLLGREASA